MKTPHWLVRFQIDFEGVRILRDTTMETHLGSCEKCSLYVEKVVAIRRWRKICRDNGFQKIRKYQPQGCFFLILGVVPPRLLILLTIAVLAAFAYGFYWIMFIWRP